MLSMSTTTFALLGLASSGLVAALPQRVVRRDGAYPNYGTGTAYSTATSTASYSSGSFPTEVSADGNKFRFPLSNGFPMPNAYQLNLIQQAAGGTLSNATPPASVSSDGITSLQLVAFNELFEVAFFTSLLQNITSNTTGYEVYDASARSTLIEALAAVQAQEQLHAINANNALQKIANVSAISPCEYTFPVTKLDDAIALAQTFTDVVLGTLQDVATIFGANGGENVKFIRGVAATIGQEGEQNGFYRTLLKKRPSAQPFLTASARDLAFSALVQTFIVPGTCPDIEKNTINLQTFDTLTLLTQDIQPVDQKLEFSFDLADVLTNSSANKSSSSDSAWLKNIASSSTSGTVSTNSFVASSSSASSPGLSLVLVNGQNKPIATALDVVSIDGTIVKLQAPFNFQSQLLFGLTIAVVAEGSNFATISDLVDNTVFGPALIEML